MITPLQQTAGIAVSELMRSMVETIEERQREEQEKANGTKKDDAVRTNPQPDESQRVANEKISAYLFGAMKPDPDAFASLVSRFSAALGITQDVDESNFSFAQRLQDALTLTQGFEKTDAQGKATTISLASFGVSQLQVVGVLNNGVNAKTDPMAALAARIAERLAVRDVQRVGRGRELMLGIRGSGRVGVCLRSGGARRHAAAGAAGSIATTR